MGVLGWGSCWKTNEGHRVGENDAQLGHYSQDLSKSAASEPQLFLLYWIATGGIIPIKGKIQLVSHLARSRHTFNSTFVLFRREYGQ